MALPGNYVQVADRVRETTTSTGMGDMVLDGPIPGFKAFSAATVIGGHYFCYEIHAVDASGVPTGDWEVGIGTIVGASPNWSLRRLYCLKKSAGTSAWNTFINFAAGTKQVSLSVVAANLDDRKINASPDIYVRADGNDSNSGFVNTADGAVATLAKAAAIASSFREAVVNVGAGTFGAFSLYENGIDISLVGAGEGVTVVGNVSAGGRNVVISVSDLTVTAVKADGEGCGLWGDCIDFAANPDGAHATASNGAWVDFGAHTISGGAASHLRAEGRGWATIEGTITVAADVTFTDGFAVAAGPFAVVDMPYGVPTIDLGVYTVTGPRYLVERNSVIDTQGSGAMYFPGTVAGSAASGGQYL